MNGKKEKAPEANPQYVYNRDPSWVQQMLEATPGPSCTSLPVCTGTSKQKVQCNHISKLQSRCHRCPSVLPPPCALHHASSQRAGNLGNNRATWTTHRKWPGLKLSDANILTLGLRTLRERYPEPRQTTIFSCFKGEYRHGSSHV